MDEQRRELTWPALILGVLLSLIMGAANVYLGLRVGMTVSASIPAAVVALAILNGLMGRKSVLEANLVQTSASAGESLAAGIIFTIPALILAGVWKEFDFWTTSLIALSGGLLGILFMIPMRRVFIVESPELQFPEGIACAKVLRTAETSDDTGSGRSGAVLIMGGLAIGAAFKFCEGLLGLLRSKAEWATVQGGRAFYFGSDLAPALVAVGVIVGLPIAVQIFAGGAIGWLIAIPLFYSPDVVVPDSADATAFAVDFASDLWSTKVRYMGVGAMLLGGVVSIWNVRSGLVAAASDLRSQFRIRPNEKSVPPTERNLDSRLVFGLAIVTVALIGIIYYQLLGAIDVTVLTTAVMIVMSFFLHGRRQLYRRTGR